MDTYRSTSSAILSIEDRLADPKTGPKERSKLEELHAVLVRLLPSIEAQGGDDFDRLSRLSSELATVVKSAAATSEDEYIAKLSWFKTEIGMAPPSDAPVIEAKPTEHSRSSTPAPSESAFSVRSLQLPEEDVSKRVMRSTSLPLTIATILLCFYCLPFTLIAISATLIVVFGKIVDGTLLSFVRALASDPGSYAGTIQIIIVPVAAALTSASVREIFRGKAAARLLIISLSGVAICIVDALLFSIASTLTAAEKGLVSQFFISAAGVLSVYSMLLVGLGIARSAAPTDSVL